MRVLALVLALVAPLGAQARKPIIRKPTAPALAPAKKVPAEMTCPTPLGTGVTSCDVLTGRDPQAGILITLPPHRGPVTLTFDLHNRQTYSEDDVRRKR